MEVGSKILTLYIFTLLSLSIYCQRQYDMDELSTCGRDINVGDDGIKLNARGAVSPTNPPQNCAVYLRSMYTRDDGSNKLQVEVEQYSIKDGGIYVDIFEGRKSAGRYIKRISQSSKIIYSQTNEITVRLTLPPVFYQPEYRFSLLIKPWKDRDVTTPNDGKESISIGAIIGIVFGCLILIALIILFLWCCCTGRVMGVLKSKEKNGFVRDSEKKLSPGVENKALANDRGKPGLINFNDPVVWNTVTGGNIENQGTGSRYHQRNAPQYDYRNANRNRNDYQNANRNRDYEPYEYDNQQRDGQRYRPADRGYNRRYDGSSRTPDYDNSQANSVARQPAKETVIDDVFESDSGKQDGDETETDVDDLTLQKRPIGGGAESPKQSRRKENEILPEEDKLDDSPHLERYKSMDLQSQPDLETISSPLHVNAGVRASIEDDDISPTSSLRKHKKADKSPKFKRAGEREPDPLAMPPEAFEPIFSGQVAGINYPGYRDEAPPAYQGGFMPYGLIPAMQFAPAAPGAQTYAYAYQTAPTGGPPATQGAYVVQNVPTSDGNRRTAFAVEHTLSPEKTSSPRERRRKNSDPFSRNENRLSGGSKRSKGKHNRDHDLDIIARGVVPPTSDQGHRSVAMKSGTDPDTGIQTNQVVWTDTVPDPTDPKPGENPQVTRKTITRVTTKSGYNDLPPQSNLLMEMDNDEPAFLSPTPSRTANALSPSHPNAIRYTPDRNNVAFYTGGESSEVPPERSSTPNSVHPPSSYNKAIRDRIPLDDSTV